MPWMQCYTKSILDISRGNMKFEYEILGDDDLKNNNEVILFLTEFGNIFQQINYLKAVGTCLQFSIVKYHNEIIGMLPVVISKKAGLSAIHIPPYTHIFGPILLDKFVKYYEEIVYSLISQIRITPLIELKIELNGQDINVFNMLRAKVIAVQTYIIAKDNEFNTQNLHPSKRRYLTKLLQALNNGELILKSGSECNKELLLLQVATAKKSGFTPSIKTLESIMEALSDSQSYALLICTSDGTPLAGAYCPFDANFAYYVVNASIEHPDPLFNRANILSTYLAIQIAKERGLGFDFEGSNVPSIANYYKQMGGQPKLFYRIQIANNWIGKSVFVLKQIKSLKYTSD